MTPWNIDYISFVLFVYLLRSNIYRDGVGVGITSPAWYLDYGSVFFFGITKLEEKKIHHSLYRHEGFSIHHWSEIRHISSHARIKKILSGVGAKSNTGFLAYIKWLTTTFSDMFTNQTRNNKALTTLSLATLFLSLPVEN